MGIEYITIAKHPKTDKVFAIFFKSDELQQAIDEYKRVVNHDLIANG